jgi:hypothetical protein
MHTELVWCSNNHSHLRSVQARMKTGYSFPYDHTMYVFFFIYMLYIPSVCIYFCLTFSLNIFPSNFVFVQFFLYLRLYLFLPFLCHYLFLPYFISVLIFILCLYFFTLLLCLYFFALLLYLYLFLPNFMSVHNFCFTLCLY